MSSLRFTLISCSNVFDFLLDVVYLVFYFLEKKYMIFYSAIWWGPCHSTYVFPCVGTESFPLSTCCLGRSLWASLHCYSYFIPHAIFPINSSAPELSWSSKYSTILWIDRMAFSAKYCSCIDKMNKVRWLIWTVFRISSYISCRGCPGMLCLSWMYCQGHYKVSIIVKYCVLSSVKTGEPMIF